MGKRSGALFLVLLVGAMGISLVGCAATPTVTAPTKTMPEMLREAGFKVFPAETPQELAHLQVCPKETVMIHERPGIRCYAFADPLGKAMYIGDEAAYRRLQGLLEKQQQRIREQRIQDDPQFWPMWGPRWGGG